MMPSDIAALQADNTRLRAKCMEMVQVLEAIDRRAADFEPSHSYPYERAIYEVAKGVRVTLDRIRRIDAEVLNRPVPIPVAIEAEDTVEFARRRAG